MRKALVVGLLGMVWGTPALATASETVRISLQPIEGAGGPALRDFMARVVRAKGYRVLTSLPTATGTGQYFSWAREHDLAAFLVADLETRGKYQKVTFLVWSGVDGSVVGRWTVAARTRRLPREIVRGFWKRLGESFARARAPISDKPVGPAAPIFIDASTPQDDAIATRRWR